MSNLFFYHVSFADNQRDYLQNFTSFLQSLIRLWRKANIARLSCNIRVKQALLILCFACLLSSGFAVAQSEVERPPCWIDYYFAPGCEQCRYIENNILSQIQEMFGGRIKMRRHNLYDSAEYAEARNILNRLALKGEDNVFVVVDGEIYVGGSKNICRDLVAVVEEQLHSGSGPVPVSRKYAAQQRETVRMIGKGESPKSKIKNRQSQGGGHSFPFSFAALLAAGLIDGVNPCAFATIVFLISSLLAGGKGGRENLFLIGLAFCSSVYLTYFLIGLGLFQVFRLSFMRLWLGNTLNWLLIFALVIMAFISFRDAWIFRLTGRPNDIILKLPGRINRLMHGIIRSNLPRKYYFAGGFFLGCVVAVLESVCTGQLYVPALAFLARTSPMRTSAIAGLALYNAMFILPLVAVFVLAWHGVGQRVFIEWSRKDFFWAKCALGCFFIFLAALLCLV